ncbi:HAMP domain-containing protein, partial [Streptomyces asoensis]|uniref:HAMP domain-containing protein n=1 Tax=Streptomyces asoensis TaxID=249586 RepID=UPI0033D6C628
MLSEPRSGRLAAWGNALLAGFVSPDDAVIAIVGEDAVHRVEGLPGEAAPVGLTLALGRLRTLGVRVTVSARGEVAQLADTINQMTETLRTFADEVTR